MLAVEAVALAVDEAVALELALVVRPDKFELLPARPNPLKKVPMNPPLDAALEVAAIFWASWAALFARATSSSVDSEGAREVGEDAGD